MQLIALLGVLLMLSCGVSSENDTFVPTKDWQEIKEGQQIPAGLHIRMDLTTGKKEAKILDESESREEASSKAVDHKDKQQQHSLSLTDEDVFKHLALDYKPDNARDTRDKYKSYKDLKKSFEDIKDQFKSDAEIINGLMERYKKLVNGDEDSPKKGSMGSSSQIGAIEAILDDLKTLVHQIDNAQWFVDAGGLDHILHPIVVNETNISLKAHAMRVLGALAQNNPKTQVEVFKRNFGSHISQILISSTNTEELSAALYAFGALLRKFPLAQERIFSTSGIQGLIAVLAKECELRLKAKAATLINDVIVEKQLVVQDTSDPLTAAQYADLDFAGWLQANAYCDTLDTLISANLYGFLEQPDITEYFIETLHSTADICMALWSQSPQMRHTLLTIGNRYKRSDDGYQHELAAAMQKVIRTLYADAATRDEL